MRVALISDVHTDLAAWDALLQHWQNGPGAFDQLWSLGDWLGYNDHNPLSLWDRINAGSLPALRDLRNNPGTRAVIGNHDVAVIDGGSVSFNGRARKVIMSQRGKVRSSEEWREEMAPWLRSQPYLLSPLPGVYLAHGAFHPTEPHLMYELYAAITIPHELSFRALRDWLTQGQAATSDKCMAANGWDSPLILITGHTHRQGLWQRPAQPHPKENWPAADNAMIPFDRIQDCATKCATLEHIVQISLTPERPVWINPGSVGESRDTGTPTCGPGWKWARYAILDWDVAQPTQAIIRLYWLPYQAATSDQQA